MTQDYRNEKEESKETMALEVVTDGKNDKTDRTQLGKCIHLYDVTQGNISAFDRKLSSSNARKIDNNN